MDPEKLDDKTYWRLWYDLLYARKEDRELLLGVLRQVIKEAFSSTATPA